MCWVYLLQCWRTLQSDPIFYIGRTNNLVRRMHEHAFHQSTYTHTFIRLMLVAYDEVDNSYVEERKRKGWTVQQKSEWATRDNYHIELSKELWSSTLQELTNLGV